MSVRAARVNASADHGSQRITPLVSRESRLPNPDHGFRARSPASRALIPSNYNEAVTALRYVHLLALVIWLGGMIAIGAIVAPSTFQVLTAEQPAAGRVLAGAVVGEVLRRFYLVSYAAGATLLISLVTMAAMGAKPAALGARIVIASAMLAVALVSGVWVTGRIDRLRQEIGTGTDGRPAAPSSLPEHDPRRQAFGRLHGLSTSLMLVNIVGGLALLYWHAREPGGAW